MAITDWHENDRPREKLLKFGENSLSDAELLAIFLRVGVKGKSAVELAQDLINHFGDLPSIFNATETGFCSANGLGPAKFVQLRAVLEMSRRHFEYGLKKGASLDSPEKTVSFLVHELAHQSREKFGVLFLDQKHCLIDFKILFTGTLNQSSVHIREIIKPALDLNAAALILAHNHPSGDPTPSLADVKTTQKIQKACQLIEIKVLDHIIIGDMGRWTSLAQERHLEQ